VTSFAHLPEAIRMLVPEIDLDWPVEQHADCARCPMADPAQRPWSFSAETKCCTFTPQLPNFLAGAALRRGGTGREVIRARLADLEGVSTWGIDPPEGRERRFEAEAAASFGRDPTLRCPYWVGGDESCGIWHDRTAVCRTWYCKHDDGLAGAVPWQLIHSALADLESRLAVWAVERGGLSGEPDTVDGWVAWFERAAALVDAITPEEAAALSTAPIERRRAEVRDFVEIRRLRRGRPLPERLVAAVTELVRTPDGSVLLAGYSAFDAVRAPASVFAFLSRLDGRPWREALGDGVDEAMVAELHRVGALRDPDGADDLPYTVEIKEQHAWARARDRER
jgi:hypothetical protein